MQNRDTAQGSLGSYTYYAFISYKRADAKWAFWLKRQLQRYRLPNRTRKIHPNLAKRLIPIFLDKTNLTPGYLDEGLRSEVQSAEHLIVICSRSAQAKSKYLDNEIQYFLDGGGTPDRIGSDHPLHRRLFQTPRGGVFSGTAEGIERRGDDMLSKKRNMTHTATGRRSAISGWMASRCYAMRGLRA